MAIKFHLTESNKPYLFAKLLSLDFKNTYYVTVIEYDKRTLDQNAKLHAMLSDIAKQSTHLNQVLSADDWKRLCVAQFRTDCIKNNLPRLSEYWQKNEFKLIPSLDGTGLVALGTQTRTLPMYVMAGFIEWLLYFGAEHDIKWSDETEQRVNYEIEN